MSDNPSFNQMLEELKAIREEKKIPLESIAEKYRIRLKYLQALEKGDLEKLPLVYDRFIFKTYLNVLNVEEPEKFLAAFDAARAPERKQTTIFNTKHTHPLPEKGKEWISKPTLLKIFYAGIPVLIVIILILILMAHHANTPNESGNKNVKELTARQIVQETNQANELKKAEKTIPTPKDTSLKVIIRAKADSWIRFIKDQTDTADFILKSKNVYTVLADSVIEFKIGNPMGITMEINSVKYDSLAKPGQVISYMKVTPKGIVALRAVFPKKRKVVKNDSTSKN